MSSAGPLAVRLDTTGSPPAALVHVGDDWITLHSRRDPLAEADRALAKAFPSALPPVIVLIGLGLGYMLDALEERGFTGRVVALDPAPVPTQPGSSIQRWQQEERLCLLAAPDYQEAASLWMRLGDGVGECPLVINPVLARACPDAVGRARTLAEKAWFDAQANSNARRRNAGRYLLNTLRNIPAIAAEGDVRALAGLTPKTAALLVAAGPSLDANLPAIIRHADRVLIIAVDTALRPLLAAGVHPHLVVGVDPTEANARHLTDLPPCPRTALVGEASLDPEAIRLFSGRTFFFRVSDHPPWPWLREAGLDRGCLRAWGSVLTTAFDLALTMRCDPIVFAGADLAFTDGRPYARGTINEEGWRREQAWGRALEDVWLAQMAQWPLVEEPGVDGRLHRTAPHLRSFRDWIATEAERASDRTIVNGTGAGILTGVGVAQRPLADVLSGLPTLPSDPVRLVAAAHGPQAEAEPDRSCPPIAAWLDFGAPHLTDAAIRHALGVGPPPCVGGPPRIGEEDQAARWSRGVLAALRVGPTADVADQPTEAELSHVTAYARLARPATIVAIGPGAPWPALAALLATESQESRVHLVSTDRRDHLDAVATRLSLSARLVHDPPHGASGDLVILGCADGGGALLDDLEQAWSRVARGGRLFVFDGTRSPGGAPVRRALFDLLDRHADLGLRHRRYFDPQERVSWVAAREDLLPGGYDFGKFADADASTAARLVPLLIDRFHPASVVDIGCGAGHWIEQFRQAGVTDVRGFEEPALLRAAAVDLAGGVIEADLSRLPSDRRYDLSLCVSLVQRVPAPVAEAAIGTCTTVSDLVVFAAPACGIGAPGFVNERPWRVWDRLFLERGFLPYDELRPAIEARWGRYHSVPDLMLVYRRIEDANGDAARGSSALRRALLHAADREFDLVLQQHWYRHAFEAAAAGRRPASEAPRHVAGELVIPPASMLADGAGTRTYRFRTSAARSMLFAGVWPDPALSEDGCGLRLVEASAGEPLEAGTWCVARDELRLASSDGTDPRVNGRRYALRMPAYVAWLERQPIDLILREAL